MNTYTITLELDRNQFIDFLDGPFGTSKIDVKVNQGAVAAPPPRLRTSKVNDAILGTLKHGPASTAELKSALVNAGLSAGSLSTGLATLQKSGAVGRSSEGAYELKQAAE
jgi:hypothetical protein